MQNPQQSQRTREVGCEKHAPRTKPVTGVAGRNESDARARDQSEMSPTLDQEMRRVPSHEDVREQKHQSHAYARGKDLDDKKQGQPAEDATDPSHPARDRDLVDLGSREKTRQRARSQKRYGGERCRRSAEPMVGPGEDDLGQTVAVVSLPPTRNNATTNPVRSEDNAPAVPVPIGWNAADPMEVATTRPNKSG